MVIHVVSARIGILSDVPKISQINFIIEIFFEMLGWSEVEFIEIQRKVLMGQSQAERRRINWS
jgi:hypothetical protein